MSGCVQYYSCFFPQASLLVGLIQGTHELLAIELGQPHVGHVS